MIDVNVNLSRWPFRRLPNDETPKLVRKLSSAGITQAWAGSFDALLHRDVAGVNLRLAEECAQHGDGLLVPFGCVNPTLPDWQEDLRRCHEEYKMPGIRLHPNYHGYTLEDPAFAELVDLAEQRGLIVQLAVRMEDERTQHPLVQVRDVDVQPLNRLLPDRPKLKLILLNALRTLRGEAVGRMASAGDVYFDISMQEGVGGIANLLDSVPLERVLFGSYCPFFILESALLKLREAELGDFRTQAITHHNAERLLNNT